MKLSPGDKIEFLDWRDRTWQKAVVIRVEHRKAGRQPTWKEAKYPFDTSTPLRFNDGSDGPRLAVRALFYADNPKYLWPCRVKGRDEIRHG